MAGIGAKMAAQDTTVITTACTPLRRKAKETQKAREQDFVTHAVHLDISQEIVLTFKKETKAKAIKESVTFAVSLDIPQENATKAKKLGSRKVFGMQTGVEKEKENENSN